MRNYKENLIVKMSFEFALKVVDFAEVLREEKRFVFADQLLRSGCSIGANVKEAQSAESRPDFVHKMKIALKEAEETEYWLELCEFSKNYPKPKELLKEIEDLLKMLSKIITTTKRNMK
jgi:four helix bundle protein